MEWRVRKSKRKFSFFPLRRYHGGRSAFTDENLVLNLNVEQLRITYTHAGAHINSYTVIHLKWQKVLSFYAKIYYLTDLELFLP